MAMRRLEFGESLTGLLIDGVRGTPFVGATLRLTREQGVTVEVPYLSNPEADQFDHVRAWFGSQSPPENMLLVTSEGTISLCGVSWSGYSENWGGARTSLGKLRPSITVLGPRDADLTEPLVMGELRSRLDALNEWADLSSITSEPTQTASGMAQALDLHLEQGREITWQQGGATLALKTTWRTSYEFDGYSRTTLISDNVYIQSSFATGPKPFSEHFAEQRKIASLMTFLYGRPLAFREHKLCDERFPARLSSGETYDHPPTELLSRATYRDRVNDIPTRRDLGRPIAYLSELGTDGLETWASNYKKWERFILPSASVLGRPNPILEDVIVSTSMSMEAAGHLLGEQPQERTTWHNGRPTTSTYTYRCLYVLDTRFPEGISDKPALSRAIANTYNTVKHADRGSFPALGAMHATATINRLIVRLLAVHISGKSEALLGPYREGRNLDKIRQVLDGNRLRITPQGQWSHDAPG